MRRFNGFRSVRIAAEPDKHRFPRVLKVNGEPFLVKGAERFCSPLRGTIVSWQNSSTIVASEVRENIDRYPPSLVLRNGGNDSGDGYNKWRFRDCMSAGEACGDG